MRDDVTPALVQQYQYEKRRDYEAAASPFSEPRRSEREGTHFPQNLSFVTMLLFLASHMPADSAAYDKRKMHACPRGMVCLQLRSSFSTTGRALHLERLSGGEDSSIFDVGFDLEPRSRQDISKQETWNTQACIVEDSVAPGSTHTTHNKHITSTSLSHTIAPPKSRVSISIHEYQRTFYGFLLILVNILPCVTCTRMHTQQRAVWAT